jgi:secondary thiamine-phosphate synthase enzyme
MTFQKAISITTHGEGKVVDLTDEVTKFVADSGISVGLVNVFVSGSTAAVTTIEYEEGVLSDLNRALAVVAPPDSPYAHDSRWGDGNGRSHVKAALVGPSLTIPIQGGIPATGTWQQIVLLELDVRKSRTRTVLLTALG